MWASGQVKECRAFAPNLYGLVCPPKKPPSFLSSWGGPRVVPMFCQMLRYVQSPGKDGGRREMWMDLEKSIGLRQEGKVTWGIA